MDSSIAATSRSELSQRRRQLRQQRRLKWLQSTWRLIALGGLTGGVIWLTTLPLWVLRQPNQVVIQGNRLLSQQTLQALIPLKYPQSLLTLQPQMIAHTLQANAPLADVTVTRQLWPPALNIEVRERPPVAVLVASGATPLATGQAAGVSLIDATGVTMPLASYKPSQRSRILPKLKVVGLRADDRRYWPQLYRVLSSSPVKIKAVDWQDPMNLVLETELGLVHIGPYSPQLPTQLQALDQMRQLPNYVNTHQVAYIDLRNPNAPALQVKNPKSKS